MLTRAFWVLFVGTTLIAACGGADRDDNATSQAVLDRTLGVTLSAPRDWDVRYDVDLLEVASPSRETVITVIAEDEPLAEDEFLQRLNGLGYTGGEIVANDRLGDRNVWRVAFTSGTLPEGTGTVHAYATTEEPSFMVTALLGNGASDGQLNEVLNSLVLPAPLGREYASWQRVSSPTDAPLFDVISLGTRSLLIAGAQGTLLRTEDAGLQWTVLTSGTDGTISAVDFDRSGRRGVAVGQDGLILRSDNGGRDWRSVPSPTDRFLTAVAFLPDGSTVVVVGIFGTILRSADAGENWQAIDVGSEESFNSVAAVPDSTDVMIVGRNAHLESPDAGLTWSVSAFSSALLDIDAVAGGFGIAASDGGIIARTDTAGFAWSFVAFLDVAIFHGVAVARDRSFFVVGTEGAIVSSRDAVQTEREASGVAVTLRGAVFGPDGTRWAVGNDGVILRSSPQ